VCGGKFSIPLPLPLLAQTSAICCGSNSGKGKGERGKESVFFGWINAVSCGVFGLRLCVCVCVCVYVCVCVFIWHHKCVSSVWVDGLDGFDGLGGWFRVVGLLPVVVV